MKWYVVHTLTGSEEKVKKALATKISDSAFTDLFGEVVIPTEQVSEIRSGKKKISQRKFFPGYVLIKMELDEKTWMLVRNTPGVTGFIGLGNSPSPLSDMEVDQILQRTQETKTRPSPKIVFEMGEMVRVTDGPFVNFNGTVEEVHPEKGKLKASVSIFGRSTPVELEYWQVEKI